MPTRGREGGGDEAGEGREEEEGPLVFALVCQRGEQDLLKLASFVHE
jgi:hypothetical protein